MGVETDIGRWEWVVRERYRRVRVVPYLLVFHMVGVWKLNISPEPIYYNTFLRAPLPTVLCASPTALETVSL